MSRQTRKAKIDKKRSEKRIRNKLVPWVQDIVVSYRIGDTSVSETSVPILSTALRTSYTQAGKDVLTFDIREFKQAEDEDPNALRDSIYAALALSLTMQYDQRTEESTPQITKTASKLAARTTQLALEEQMAEREAKKTLLNYLKSRRLSIAATESQWVVEATRSTALLSVSDPMKNTIEQIVFMLENGNVNEATRLSRQALRLARLPLSQAQGKVLGTISRSLENLLSPLVQARTITSLRRQSTRLDANEKKWQTVGGDKVRDTHVDVNGQVRTIEEPFVLARGLLQYPGDGSLGADASEIINCRCATEYL